LASGCDRPVDLSRLAFLAILLFGGPQPASVGQFQFPFQALSGELVVLRAGLGVVCDLFQDFLSRDGRECLGGLYGLLHLGGVHQGLLGGLLGLAHGVGVSFQACTAMTIRAMTTAGAMMNSPKAAM